MRSTAPPLTCLNVAFAFIIWLQQHQRQEVGNGAADLEGEQRQAGGRTAGVLGQRGELEEAAGHLQGGERRTQEKGDAFMPPCRRRNPPRPSLHCRFWVKYKKKNQINAYTVSVVSIHILHSYTDTYARKRIYKCHHSHNVLFNRWKVLQFQFIVSEILLLSSYTYIFMPIEFLSSTSLTSVAFLTKQLLCYYSALEKPSWFC